MTNTELIAELRGHILSVPLTLLHDAADALEAAEQRIKELESQAAFFDAEKLNYQENIEYRDERIKELGARTPKWTMLKDEMPKPHTTVLVSGIEAINNTRVYKVMVNDNGTLRPTDYAPSIMWDCWMPFGSPNCADGERGTDGKEEG